MKRSELIHLQPDSVEFFRIVREREIKWVYESASLIAKGLILADIAIEEFGAETPPAIIAIRDDCEEWLIDFTIIQHTMDKATGPHLPRRKIIDTHRASLSYAERKERYRAQIEPD